MSKDKIIIVGVLLTTCLLLGGAAIVFKEPVDTGRIVYNICQKTRMSLTIPEKECADASYKYKYEYICKEGNTSADNQCWVESNDQLEAY